jgi:hypothetical protein
MSISFESKLQASQGLPHGFELQQRSDGRRQGPGAAGGPGGPGPARPGGRGLRLGLVRLLAGRYTALVIALVRRKRFFDKLVGNAGALALCAAPMPSHSVGASSKMANEYPLTWLPRRNRMNEPVPLQC